MNDKATLFFIVLTFLSFANVAQSNDNLWLAIQAKAGDDITTSSFPNRREFILDEEKMQQLLQQTQRAYKGHSPTPINLPLPNGRIVAVTPVESTVLPLPLAKRYPQIKTYTLINPNNESDNEIISGRLDFTSSGFHAMLQTKEGDTIFIDPRQGTQHHYLSYRKKDQHPTPPHQCKLTTTDNNVSIHSPQDNDDQYRNASTNTKNLHSYRIAVATTGEYTHLQGGTVEAGLSAVVTTINRINQVYERDLGIHLTLADNNDAIIFTDGTNDPFSNGKSHLLMTENQDTLDTLIGTNNYDIGHVLGTSGGGLAIINSLCSNNAKAKGASGISDPNSESFYIDFLAHEIGHQFGATHTFNGNQGLCNSNTRTARTAFEPGSGSTIMAYTGICGRDNLQAEADAMFHSGSIKQIKTKLETHNCGTHTQNPNQPPVVNAGKNYNIPFGTPFTLQGTAHDPENDVLSYSWQQVDAGSSTTIWHDVGNNALFRAYLPTHSPTRTFPPLTNLLSHQQTKGEMLPTTQRTLTFNLTVQDGKKNTSNDQVTLQVEDTGTRFALNLPYSHYTIGDQSLLTWHVAQTNQAPIHCTEVDIYLSTDGGNTFATQLANRVMNTGKASIYIPADIAPSHQGRFKIACSNNIFFALSYSNFTLSHKISNHTAPTAPEPNLIVTKKGTSPYGTDTSTTKTDEKKQGGSFHPIILSLIILLLFIRRKKNIGNVSHPLST